MPAVPIPVNLGRDGVALRRLRARDAGPFAQAFRDDPELAPAIAMEEDPSEAWVRRFIASQPRLRARGDSLALAVSDAPKGPFVGVVLLHAVSWRHRRAELGFWLVPAVRGAGRGRAAVGLFADWAFAQLPLDRLEMMTTPDNVAALSLAEALGFEREGVLRSRLRVRGRPVDVVMLARLRARG